VFICGIVPAVDEPNRGPLRRDRIVAEARTLIRQGGTDALSLRKLAAHLGVTAPALYAHITDKRDLLRAVAEVEFDALLADMERVEDEDPIERLRAYARVYLAHARAEPQLFGVMFLFPPDAGVGFADQTTLPAATRAFALPLATVEEAIASGAIVADDPLLVALTLWTSTHGIAATLQLGLALPAALEDQLIDAATARLLRGWGR
jgi:AcrR family transcriptional regulator